MLVKNQIASIIYKPYYRSDGFEPSDRSFNLLINEQDVQVCDATGDAVSTKAWYIKKVAHMQNDF